MNTSGEGKYKVWLKSINIGDDKLYILGGGEKSHLGGVVVCEPKKETVVIKLEEHYDYIVLKPIAEKACEKYHKKIIATGGIHIDNASKKEIDLLIENCRSLIKCI